MLTAHVAVSNKPFVTVLKFGSLSKSVTTPFSPVTQLSICIQFHFYSCLGLSLSTRPSEPLPRPLEDNDLSN